MTTITVGGWSCRCGNLTFTDVRSTCPAELRVECPTCRDSAVVMPAPLGQAPRL